MVLNKAAQQSAGAASPAGPSPTGSRPWQVVVVLLKEK
jgi:hypothetical protein